MATDGVLRLFGVTPIRTSSGTDFVAIGIPRAAAAGEIDAALHSLLRGFGVALLLALIVVPAGIRWSVTGPLGDVADAIRRVSEGELGARSGLRGAPAEIDTLARAFDDMAATLEKRQQEVARQTALLTTQERRFRALIENSSDGVVLVDEEGRMTYASPSTTRLLGYSPEELAGQSAFVHIHPDDTGAQVKLFVEILQRPGASVEGCFRLQHRDGSWRWVESVGTNLLGDPAVRALVANYRDVTARREAEEQLRQVHAELERRVDARTADLVKANEALQAEIAERAIIEQHLMKLWRGVEQTTDAMFVTDRQGIIEYVNPSFERVTGYSLKEAVGATPSLVHSGQHDRRFYEFLWETILSGQVFRSVFVNRSKDGRIYYEDRTITPVRDANGEITHFVSTGRDITRTRRTEQALRRMNARLEEEANRIASVLHDEAGQFLTAAHITLAGVARDLPAETRDRLQDVRHNLDEVEHQLRRLAHELRPRILDDIGLVDALKFLAAGVAKRTGLAITVEAPVKSRCCPLGETAIYRLVQEALTNVSRHAQATRVSIVVSQEEQNVVCTVQDDGIGFDPEAVASRRGQAGLGLQGIQDRLEAVNGLLHITSAPGQGTTLRADVPLED